MARNRPGRKPSDLRKLDVRLEFDTEQEGLLVRELGGGPWVMSVIRAALAEISDTPPEIAAQLVEPADGSDLELRITVPRALLPTHRRQKIASG